MRQFAAITQDQYHSAMEQQYDKVLMRDSVGVGKLGDFSVGQWVMVKRRRPR